MLRFIRSCPTARKKEIRLCDIVRKWMLLLLLVPLLLHAGENDPLVLESESALNRDSFALLKNCYASGGYLLSMNGKTSLLQFPEIDFGERLLSLAVVGSRSGWGKNLPVQITFRLDHAEGPVIGRTRFTNTGSWQNFQEAPVPLEIPLSGKARIVLQIEIASNARAMNIDCIRFTAEGNPEPPRIPEFDSAEARLSRDSSDYTYSHTLVDLDGLAASNIRPSSSWNAMGMDRAGRVYIGWTSYRKDQTEDHLIMRWDPATGERKVMGSLIQASEAAGNLEKDEAIPKGHTRFVLVGNDLYLASMGFHDFKRRSSVTNLKKYRGAHLYRINVAEEKIEDLSAKLPQGVLLVNEGVIALEPAGEGRYLVGLTHPLSGLVIYDLQEQRVVRKVKGIPFSSTNSPFTMVSRDFFVTPKGKAYLARGLESLRHAVVTNSVYTYEVGKDELEKGRDSTVGGYWAGHALTRDGKHIWFITVTGKLYRLDVASGKIRFMKDLVPLANPTWNFFSWGLTMVEGRKILVVCSSTDRMEGGELIEYDIKTKKLRRVLAAGGAVYYASNLYNPVRKEFYIARFGSECPSSWEGNCKIMVVKVEQPQRKAR